MESELPTLIKLSTGAGGGDFDKIRSGGGRNYRMLSNNVISFVHHCKHVLREQLFIDLNENRMIGMLMQRLDPYRFKIFFREEEQEECVVGGLPGGLELDAQTDGVEDIGSI